MIGPTDLLHPSPAPHFKTFQVFLICCPERPSEEIYAHVMWWLGAYSVESMTMLKKPQPPTGSNPVVIESISMF